MTARGEIIRADRLKKLATLKKAGVEAYPSRAERSALAAEFLTQFKEAKAPSGDFTLVGRIRALRTHGKAAFFDVADESGKVQWFLSQEALGEALFEQATTLFDEGDFIEGKGTALVTARGEKSLAVKAVRLLAKSLRPAPRDWYGLKDKETRFRQRYLDLLLNADVKKAFETRSKIIAALRRFLDKAGFLEVETPVLQTLAGGALARPFKTHLNALDLDLYLRVAPELYLKRLLIGGFEKVYEMGRNFRNEGMDPSHNPEFTELEFYWAYQDRAGLMSFTERFLGAVVKEVLGQDEIKVGESVISFKAPWPRVRFTDLLKDKAGVDYAAIDRDGLAKKAAELGLKIDPALGKGKIADEIFKKHGRESLIQPTFVIDHPLEISPLAKGKPDNPNEALRFQLIIADNEYVNAYSELNDPLDQAERFKAQVEAAKQGDFETQPYDQDYIEALEYGLPPAAGWGLGVDRFAALLTSQPTLRDIILFPTMRPIEKSKAATEGAPY